MSLKTVYLLIAFLFASFVTQALTRQSTFTPQNVSSDDFINVHIEEGNESAVLKWGLSHDAYDILKSKGAKLIVKYNNKPTISRSQSETSKDEWEFSQPIDLDRHSFQINNLTGNEVYYFQIGIVENADSGFLKNENRSIVWSKEVSCLVGRSWGLIRLLILFGALGFFIYGMKTMSEGIQQAAGSSMRKMLTSLTSNRVKGVLTGFGITSIIQSSSVTTVMTVSFVNAGVLSLRQSAGVMMGANIGTTITAWIVLFLGFKLDISEYAFIILAFATPLLFISKGKSRAWASALFGFCILFIGLNAMRLSVPTIDESTGLVQFFLDFKDQWYGTLLFVLLGCVVTMIIQSSSAAMALTLALVSAGTIPFDVACAMVLGENIGTTITAELAALIANVHAKRSARIHSLFNIIGVTWMLFVFPFFLDFMGYIVGGADFDEKNPEMANAAIALFHTMFNISNVFFLIWFVPQLVALASQTVKSRGEVDEEFKLDFISGPLGSTAELCVLEAKKEVAKFGKITAKMNRFIHSYINTTDRKIKSKMLQKIEKYEDITDHVEIEISNYLGETARLEMSEEVSKRMRAMLNISTDLERIGDIFFQMSKTLERKDRNKIYFSPEQREGINKMIKVVEEAFEIMNQNLNAEYESVSLDKAMTKEHEINSLRDVLRKEHLALIGTGNNMDNALIFNDMFSSLEKVGDHIINVSEHVSGHNIH